MSFQPKFVVSSDALPRGRTIDFTSGETTPPLVAESAVAVIPDTCACAKLGTDKKYALVFHGGAGNVARDVDPDVYYKELTNILAGASALCEKAVIGELSAVDVVEGTVRLLESCELFNAGRGAVYTSDGVHELEGSIMDGSTMQCGAVTGVTQVEHPITLAHDIMLSTPHVMLSCPGAERFAKGQIQGVKPSKKHHIVSNAFFTSFGRKTEYEIMKMEMKKGGDFSYGGMEVSPVPSPVGSPKGSGSDGSGSTPADLEDEEEFMEFSFPHAQDVGETVGCVVMVNGNVAAATCTGGRMFKMPGRVGDSPIIGAGTYACNTTCAVSGTGSGEEYQRMCTAFDVHARVKYTGVSVQKACEDHISESFEPGTGGIIAVDADGRFGITQNTPSMPRGVIDSEGTSYISVWDEHVDV